MSTSKDHAGCDVVDLMSKDLGLSQELAAQSKSATPLGALATQLYQIHQAGGAGGLDFSSISVVAKQVSHLECN